MPQENNNAETEGSRFSGYCRICGNFGRSICAINGPALRFHFCKVVSGKARGSEYVNTNGICIYYETYGAGPPVLVLHGGLGSIEGRWPILILLSQQIVVVMDDRPTPACH
jgi:hypothetical protein